MAKRISRQRSPKPKIAGSTPAEGTKLKKVDDDEYQTACGVYSVIRNRGITGAWTRNKHGWLVCKETVVLSWVPSVNKARRFLQILGIE